MSNQRSREGGGFGVCICPVQEGECVEIFSWKLPAIKYYLRREELEATLRGRILPVQLRATLNHVLLNSPIPHTLLLLVPVRNFILAGMLFYKTHL